MISNKSCLACRNIPIALAIRKINWQTICLNKAQQTSRYECRHLYIDDSDAGKYMETFLAGDCLPILYPSGGTLSIKNGEEREVIFNDSVDEILAFYKNNLDAQPMQDWDKDHLWYYAEDFQPDYDASFM